MKIQDLIPSLGYTTNIAICTSHNMLWYGTKEDILSDTNSNIYLIVAAKDISTIDLECANEEATMRIEI